MENINQDLLAALPSIATTVLGSYIVIKLQPSVRLQCSATHQFVFNISEGVDAPFNLFTRTHVIQNLEKVAAKNVEIVHAFRPQYFRIARLFE
ncbi:MAG: hypothetical protein HOM07_14370 [Rhodospirillaceae bacterium]|nr:hypothetical protein [Rhodospirillaceae bacterium]